MLTNKMPSYGKFTVRTLLLLTKFTERHLEYPFIQSAVASYISHYLCSCLHMYETLCTALSLIRVICLQLCVLCGVCEQ